MRGYGEWSGSDFIKNPLFWPSREGRGALVSQRALNRAPVLGAGSLDHWTAREVPSGSNFK